MRKPPHNPNHFRDLLLRNEERLSQLGLENDPPYTIKRAKSLSRLANGSVAYQSAVELSKDLDKIEWQQAFQQHNRIDIPPPVEGLTYTLGCTLIGSKVYRISSPDIVRHIVVCGASGSGKTTLIAYLVEQLVAEAPCIFFDHKDEGGRFLPFSKDALYIPLDKHRWNILESAADQKQFLQYLSALLTRFASLVTVTSNAFRAKLLALCSDKDNLPSLQDLAKIFEIYAKQEKRSTLQTAARALEDIVNTLGEWARVRKGKFPIGCTQLTILPCKDLPPSIESFLISIIYKRLTDSASHQGHDTSHKLSLIFDEAHPVFGEEHQLSSGAGRISIQTEMMTRSRSYGFATILGIQSASKLQKSVLDNSGTFIVLRCSSEAESKFCCRRLGLDESRYNEIMQLGTGEAWVVSPRCTNPVKIRIPYKELGDYKSAESITSAMQYIWDHWHQNAEFSPVDEDENETVDFREILGEPTKPETSAEPASDEPNVVKTQKSEHSTPVILDDFTVLLKSCASSSELGASAHYKSIGWSAGKGHRIKGKLIEAGWITIKRVTSARGGRPRETLLLTNLGKEVLNER